jgi:maltooligosyltrehalose trehalohydrolase
LVTQVGLHGVWADDFHHGVRVSLTGERDGYYAAYEPGAVKLAETINHGWLYRGQAYPPHGRPRGKSADGLAREAFIYCIQNHDQIGNRALGDRLHAMVSLDAYCAASSLLLFLPMTPLLFMGQEWASTSPFMFFTDHDAELGRAISRGRREEFKHFSAFAQSNARDAIPDPQEVTTFLRSKLRWEERAQPAHARVLALYRGLLELRRSHPVLNDPGATMEASALGPVLVVERRSPTHGRLRLFFNLGTAAVAWEKLDVLAGVPVAFASNGQTQLESELAAATAVITSD